MGTKEFAQTTLELITHHRTTDFATDDQTELGWASILRQRLNDEMT